MLRMLSISIYIFNSIRKRVPLSSDLAALYRSQSTGSSSRDSTVTNIGHTRFATSSINRVPELHPHEWVPFRDENVSEK